MQWLDFKLHSYFVPWLSPVAGDKCKGYCKVCYKTFELSNMGIRAVESHAQEPLLHQKNLKIKSCQQFIAICLYLGVIFGTIAKQMLLQLMLKEADIKSLTLTNIFAVETCVVVERNISFSLALMQHDLFIFKLVVIFE